MAQDFECRRPDYQRLGSYLCSCYSLCLVFAFMWYVNQPLFHMLGFILHFAYFGLGELGIVIPGFVCVCCSLVQVYFLRMGQSDSFVLVAELCFATCFVSICLVNETN